ncbi:MAG TPA: DUF3263 domain-containing protein [Acidimicrobiales bacterium]|nr:DUF3263 domain-containing protein [Acidimicrobiales bacterium]
MTRAQPLTDEEKAMLAFEKLHWRYRGSRESAIRDLFGTSETGYTQKLLALFDRREALEHQPGVVNRVRRRTQEARRRRARVAAAR